MLAVAINCSHFRYNIQESLRVCKREGKKRNISTSKLQCSVLNNISARLTKLIKSQIQNPKLTEKTERKLH